MVLRNNTNSQLFQLGVVHQEKVVELFFHPLNKKQELYHLATESLQQTK